MQAPTFKDWLNSDNVVKFHNGYRTQCTLYRKLFSLQELEKYYDREYGFAEN
jgi:hypothetical protein